MLLRSMNLCLDLRGILLFFFGGDDTVIKEGN